MRNGVAAGAVDVWQNVINGVAAGAIRLFDKV